MLILDKQRAIERIVALAQGRADGGAEAQPARPGSRTRHKVALYERKPVVTTEPVVAAFAPLNVPQPEPIRRRRRRRASTPTQVAPVRPAPAT